MVRVEVHSGGPEPLVVKRCVGAGAAVLRAEGERLRAAAHPGVVEVLASEGTDDLWELRLAHGGRPLDVVGPVSVPQAAGIVASVAATLADLHEIGVVHGRIATGHVLVGPHGRPLLCGFGPRTDAEPADDVAGLGTLLAGLLGAAAEAEPIPQHRWLRRRAWSGGDRRALLLLAEQARAEPSTRRPTARRLAAAISEAVPCAQVQPPAADPSPAAPLSADDPLDALRSSASHASPGRSRLPALACAAVVVLLAGVGGVRSMDADVRRIDAPRASSTPATSSTVASRPVRPRHLRPTTSTTAERPVPCATPPGTARGACAALEVQGTTVVVGERRYEVGRPGDHVVIGDWDCDGAATPAVLRPATGDIFLFSSWAGAEALSVHPVARVEGAADLSVERTAQGCARLIAQTPSGPVPIVPEPVT